MTRDALAGRRLRILGLAFNLTDGIVLGGLIAFTAAIIFSYRRLRAPAMDLKIGLVCLALYLVSEAVFPRSRRPWVRFVVRTATVQITFLQVYKLANELQTAFFPWQDERVLALEQAVFGFQPLVALQKLYTVPLNEWMFFVYVFYVLIYPAL